MSEKARLATDCEIAALIRARRKSKNLTQQQVADRADMNIRHYQHFEGGERSLVTASFFTTMAVLAALEIDPDSFIRAYVKVYRK